MLHWGNGVPDVAACYEVDMAEVFVYEPMSTIRSFHHALHSRLDLTRLSHPINSFERAAGAQFLGARPEVLGVVGANVTSLKHIFILTKHVELGGSTSSL